MYRKLMQTQKQEYKNRITHNSQTGIVFIKYIIIEKNILNWYILQPCLYSVLYIATVKI